MYVMKSNRTLTVIITGSSFYSFRGREIDRDRGGGRQSHREKKNILRIDR